MNRTTHSSRGRRSSAKHRAKLLAAFDRSGLSAAVFARKHDLNYTTFCGWRQRRDKAVGSPEFVQVDLPVGPGSPEVTIEVGGKARLRIHFPEQIPLVVALLAQLQKEAAC